MARKHRDPWWKIPPGTSDLGDAVVADAANLEAQQSSMRANYLVWESFARGAPVSNLRFSMSKTMASFNPALGSAFAETPSLNVTGMVIEAIQSAIFSQRTFISFDTTGAMFKARRAAQKKTRFVDGVWYQNDFYTHLARRGRDASVCGTGFIKGTVPFPKQKRIVLERRHPECILVDLREAADGDPSRYIDRDYVLKEKVKDWYPKYADQIDSLRTVWGWGLTGHGMDHGDDWTVITDCYWLAPNRKNDGRHILACGNVILVDEPWKLGRLNLDRFTYNDTSDGWFGKGVVQDLMGLQCELDDNERNISDGIRATAHAKILRHIMSGTPKSHFDDKNGTIIDWTGDHPPQFISPQAFTPEVYARSVTIIQQMLKRAGVPEMWVQGTKPSGIDSGEGLRELQDQVSQRFLDIGQRNEKSCEGVAHLTCALARQYGARVRTAFDEPIAWDDVSADGLEIAKAYPVSGLPQNPAARKQRIEEDFRKGNTSRMDYLRLRQYPDTEAWTNDQIAPALLVEEQLERIVDTGTYEAPNPYQDNAYAFETATLWHNRLTREWMEGAEGVTDGIIGLIERYIDAAKANMEATVAAKQALMPSPNPVQSYVPQQAAAAPALPPVQ